MEINKTLPERIANDILSMITMEKRFSPGEKLPNEVELSKQLHISRTTLREAIRILVTNGVLQIQRGKGTFVRADFLIDETTASIQQLSDASVNVRDLYEIRLIFEPEAAYYATLRATDEEMALILKYGNEIERKIKHAEDRTEVEKLFHQSIAKATHNEFIDKLMPVIFEAIDKGVALSYANETAASGTVRDHRMIMDFMVARNAEGAKNAMKIHILHAIEDLQMK